MCNDSIADSPLMDASMYVSTHDVEWVEMDGGGLLGPTRMPIIVESTPDVSTVDNDKIHREHTRIEDVDEGDSPLIVAEDFSQETFPNARKQMGPSFDDVAPLHARDWADINTTIAQATQTFDIELGKLESAGGWRGATHKAAMDNVRQSFPEPLAAAEGARVMGILVDTFQKMIFAVRQNIVNNGPNYDNDLAKYPEHRDLVNDHYNSFARKVMGEIYAPAIEQISVRNPTFTAGGAPPVGQTGLPPGGPSAFGGSGGMPSLGGGGGPGSFGGPNIPEFKGPTLPETDLPAPPDGLGDPTLPAAAEALPKGLSDAAQGAGGAPSPTGAGGRPPEGALGLGPKGLGGTPPKAGKGGGGASRGGGAGAGRAPLTGRPAGSTAAATGTAGTPTTAARAGVGANPGAGAPGAGAPAAGQRPGDANAKGYQVNKALRRKKTGEQVVGKADAIVPVVGEPEKREAARPEPEVNPSDLIN